MEQEDKHMPMLCSGQVCGGQGARERTKSKIKYAGASTKQMHCYTSPRGEMN